MLICADVLDWANEYQGAPFHAMLCDPPYELGFMGKAWDGTGISYLKETWQALAQHLHPGAFIMAFASTRGFHRQAVAMEDAGLIMHPFIAWAFGSGFPKATRVNGAPEFEGHRYGRQALKPAIEPILVFQKPYAGRAVDCITETGAGALWVDGGRVGVSNGDPNWRDANQESVGGDSWFNAQGIRHAKNINPSGRWPSNLILSHSPGCECAPQNGKETIDDWRCVAGCPVKALGEQSGERVSGGRNGDRKGQRNAYHGGHGGPVRFPQAASTGTAARFFKQVSTRLDEADPFIYQAKASRGEREAGLAGFEPHLFDKGHGRTMDGGEDTRGRPPSVRKNVHPTVKSIDLTTYLATLLLPPAEYAPRRILIPFAGVASEMIGAWRAGWDEIVGIELSEEYCEIGRARLEHWRGVGVQTSFA
jgi:site-specific DNA-methyltransferase (adenine-specific)